MIHSPWFTYRWAQIGVVHNWICKIGQFILAKSSQKILDSWISKQHTIWIFFHITIFRTLSTIASTFNKSDVHFRCPLWTVLFSYLMLKVKRLIQLMHLIHLFQVRRWSRLMAREMKGNCIYLWLIQYMSKVWSISYREQHIRLLTLIL